MNWNLRQREFENAMKFTHLTLLLVAGAVAAAAQTPAKPAAPAAAKAKPAVAAGKTAGTSATADKLPPGVPVVHGIKKVAFSLRYQDIKIGTGDDATPNKLYKVKYTGWLAADGHKFDASDDHSTPKLDADGKPEKDADGKPILVQGQPISFPQGFGRVIPGWDQGFSGMKIGGKRRLFIPWQLAYGALGRPGPDAAHPGIPPKADLIFDVELVEISDMPMPQGHPGMPGMAGHPMPMTPRQPTGAPAAPATPSAAPAPAAPAATPAPAAAAPAATPAPAAPATPPPAK
jgi:peptidylprolyl isomerase